MDAERADSIVRALDRLVAALHKGVWDHIYVVIVLLTLLVLIWYTIETQRLRKANQDQTAKTAQLLNEAQRQNEVSAHLLREARRQNEVSVMPILAMAVEPVTGGDTDRIVLINVGSGPAFNLSIDPLHWDSRDLKIEHGSSILRSGQSDELLFHVVEGNSGNLLGARTLGHWIHVKRMPSPLNIVVRCTSVNSRVYTFRFVCTSQLGKLRISYEGTAADGDAMRHPEAIAG
jgi:hypothetical protein